MKRSEFFVLVGVLFIFVTSAHADDAGPWKVILQTKVTHQTSVAGFLNETFGITAGPHGEVHYSIDGGKTWPKAKNSSLCRYGLDILNESLAWTTGNGGHVRVSTDGGKNWQALSDLNISQYICFLDEKTGWVASQTKRLWATANGGQTWTELTPPQDAKSFVAMTLRTADDGYVLDKSGVLHTTRDGGQTWSSQSLGLKKKIFMTSRLPTAAMRFFDSDHGLIVLSLKGNKNIVATRTADGGNTWKQEHVPSTIGMPFLTHDGTMLTVSFAGSITVLRYQSP